MLNSLIRFLFPLLKGIEESVERIETHMVTKEEFDASQSAYFAKVKALIVKLQAHPAAADFTAELNALKAAEADLPADDTDGTATAGTVDPAP